MAMTKQEMEQFKELNDLLSPGKMENQPKTPEFVGGLVANRCYQDEAFAEAFRADPDATMRALAREHGVELSDTLKIVACENDEATWHVPAPSAVTLAKARSSKLSDAQMSQVSGGEIFIVAIVGATVAATAGAAVVAGGAAGSGLAIADAVKRKKKKKGKK